MKRGPKSSKKSFVVPVTFRLNKKQFEHLNLQAKRYQPGGDVSEHIRACIFESWFKRLKGEIPKKKESKRWNYTTRVVFKVSEAQNRRLSRLAKRHTAGDVSKYIRWCLFESGTIVVGRKKKK